jgi:hypothetical protein
VIQKWVEEHGNDPRWNYVYNTHQLGSDAQTRWESIYRSDPDDEDIIIFLDLDGDELAHPEVLAHLIDYYADGTLTTYGSYESKPHNPNCIPALPYPAGVIATRSYRAFGHVYFNHLRTMKAKIWRAIPIYEFKWSTGPQQGEWYAKGCDVQFTIPALELAGPRFKVIDEVLMYYNSINPMSAWRVCKEQTTMATFDFFRRAPLPIFS